jgi:hypothetical protein
MTATGTSPFCTSRSAAARSSSAPLPSGSAVVLTRSAVSALSPSTMRRLISLPSSSTTAIRTRDVEFPPWFPNTDAKIEKNRIGNRKVSAWATRSRLRLVQLIRSSVVIIL